MQKMLSNNNLKNVAAIILLFLVIFAGLILYFKKSKSVSTKSIKLTPVVTAPVNTKKEIIVEKDSTPSNQKSKTTFSQEIRQILVEGTDSATEIAPSSKSELIAMAKQHKGKSDPFAGQKSDTKLATKSLPNLPKLPSSSPSFSSLPSMASLPASEYDSTPIVEPPTLKLKGFLNDKAIISYNGKTQVAITGQTVDTIRIIQVSDSTSTIKYKQNGKVYTASLPSDNIKSKILKPLK